VRARPEDVSPRDAHVVERRSCEVNTATTPGFGHFSRSGPCIETLQYWVNVDFETRHPVGLTSGMVATDGRWDVRPGNFSTARVPVDDVHSSSPNLVRFEVQSGGRVERASERRADAASRESPTAPSGKQHAVSHSQTGNMTVYAMLTRPEWLAVVLTDFETFQASVYFSCPDAVDFDANVGPRLADVLRYQPKFPTFTCRVVDATRDPASFAFAVLGAAGAVVSCASACFWWCVMEEDPSEDDGLLLPHARTPLLATATAPERGNDAGADAARREVAGAG